MPTLIYQSPVTEELLADFWREAARLEFLGATGALCHTAVYLQQSRGYAGDERFKSTIIGSVTRQALEDLVHAGSYAARVRQNRDGKSSVRRGSGAGRSRLFSGDQMPEEVAIVPFLAKPGEIAGLGFADATALAPVNFKFHSLVQSSNGYQEAGMALLDLLRLPIAKAFNDHVFAFFDLDAAVTLQLKWLRSSFQFLPIVAVHDHDKIRTISAWEYLTQANRIIVTGQLDARAFRQAKIGNAKLYHARQLHDRMPAAPATLPRDLGSPGDVQRALLDLWWSAPTPWLNSAIKEASSWQTALAEHISQMTSDEAEQFLEEVELTAADRYDLHLECRRYLRGKSSPLLKSELLAPRVKVGDKIAQIRSDGWFDDKLNKRICDAILLNRIVRPRFTPAYVCGKVMPPDSPAIEFAVSESRVRERGLLGAIKLELGKKSIKWDFLRGWSQHGWKIATAGRDLTEQTDTDVVGATACGFQFPQFEIESLGFKSRPKLEPDIAPAANLQPPNPLSLKSCRPIACNHPAVRSYWATIKAFLAMAMAPHLRGQPPAVGLWGPGAASLMGQLATTFGCRLADLPRRTSAARKFGQLQKRVKDHNWPVCIKPEAGELCPAQGLTQLEPQNVFACIVETERDNLQRAGWWTIQVLDGCGAAKLVEQLGTAVVLNYFKQYANQRLFTQFDPANPVESLWNDFGTWYGPIGRGGPVRANCAELIGLPPIVAASSRGAL